MLITVKNAALYRAWINYLTHGKGVDHSTPDIRTRAFFNSQKAEPVPLFN